MVYEANARIRDPVYGTAGAIFQLQKQVEELQAELARAQAEAVKVHAQNANLMALICMRMSQTLNEGNNLATADSLAAAATSPCFLQSDSFYVDESSLQGAAIWEEPLWT